MPGENGQPVDRAKGNALQKYSTHILAAVAIAAISYMVGYTLGGGGGKTEPLIAMTPAPSLVQTAEPSAEPSEISKELPVPEESVQPDPVESIDLIITPEPTPEEEISPGPAVSPSAIPTQTPNAATPVPSVVQTPVPVPTPQPAESHYTADGKLRLNLATKAELMALPGIGEVIAERIIEYRTEHGGFKSVAELNFIKGIGEKKFADLKDLVSAD